tara:strand:+ start:189 stop:983 length:795 start_codon:yes stop_codon:yes gene_type:complete
MKNILSNLKKIIEIFFLNICPVLYLGLTRSQDSHDRFILGLEIAKNKFNSQKIKVLDVGSGSGNFYAYLKSHFLNLDYLGLEFDNEKIKSKKFKKNNFKIIPQDLRKEWFFGEFDFVWSSEVIEHILDDHSFFQNLLRSTKKHGYIAITTPYIDSYINFANKFGWSTEPSNIEDGGHVRLGYNKNDLMNFANKYNLKLIGIYFVTECSDFRAKNIFKTNNGLYCYIFNILYYLKILKYKRFINLNSDDNKIKYFSIAATFQKIE